jgi:hypothetical protein
MPNFVRRRRRPALRWQGLLCWALLSGAPAAFAQSEDSPLHTFGYFQNALQYTWDYDRDVRQKTFLAQQLNLFLQKDLGERWTALVDFEAVNNFSSFRRWGSFNLAEAWIRYRAGAPFNVKAGLHVPPFNNLNEIKNRTPLLPYIIRPYVYETSLSESIETGAFVPERAYAQVYGFLSAGAFKLDYGAYLGNSPNINDRREQGQTGADTTDTYLVGGRIGLRYGELKAGISGTRDVFVLADSLYGQSVPTPAFTGSIERYRLGADLSYTLGRFSLETEFINISHDEGTLDADVEVTFFYATLGCYATDRLFVYASYWLDRERQRYPGGLIRVDVDVPTAGASYVLNDMVTLKAQYAYVGIDVDAGPDQSVFPSTFSHFSTAVSVVF